MGPFEREEQAIDDAYANGDISATEYREQMRDLQRDYRGAAEEAAQDAYDREMSNW